MLRVVIRYGLMQHFFPWFVVQWAACFFGMVRTRAWGAQGYPPLASSQHASRASAVDWWA